MAGRRGRKVVTVFLVAITTLGAVVAVDPARGGADPPAVTIPATTAPPTTVPATTVPPTTVSPTTAPATTVSPTTVPAVTTGAEVPEVRVDLAVRPAPGGPWLGAGVDTSGVPLTIDVPARTGQAANVTFRVRHNGAVTTTIGLHALGYDPRAFVRWRLAGRDVTRTVRLGELRLRIEPGAHRDLTLVMGLRATTPDHFSLGRTLTAKVTGSDSRDRIRAEVWRGPVPVRFHDVGLALGLPRLSHSFDLDAGPIDDDGVDDLVMATHGHVEVRLNRQPGLEPVFANTIGDLHACAVGDANRDGRSDVYCTRGVMRGTGSASNSLWLQGGNLTFTNRAGQYGVTDPFGRGRFPTFVDLDHRWGIDLFVGNEHPRQDGERSQNHTFLHAQGDAFVDAWLGLRRGIGGLCVQAFDQDGIGWADILVCGDDGPANTGWHPSRNELHLFRNLQGPGGGRRLVDVAHRLGIDFGGVEAARLAHLNGDRHPDLVVATRSSLTIWPGLNRGHFGLPVLHDDLRAGHGITLADVDGRRGLDVFVVQGCGGPQNVNIDDRLYLDTGPGWSWDRARLPTGIAGCGDTAEALDVDGDGVDDLVVGNGRWSAEGPIQALTSGPYWG
jgi:hypothetical protein